MKDTLSLSEFDFRNKLQKPVQPHRGKPLMEEKHRTRKELRVAMTMMRRMKRT